MEQAWAPQKVERDAARIGTVVARWLRPRGPLLVQLAGRPLTLRVVRIGSVSIPPNGAVAVIRGGPEAVLAIGGGPLVRGLAQAILGGPDELPAARPVTVAEQAIWALAVATMLDAVGGGFSVEPSAIAPEAVAGAAAVVELAVDGAGRGAAWIALPAAVLDRQPPPVALAGLADRAWLDDTLEPAPVVIAHAAMTIGELDRLTPRDVVVVGAVAAAGQGSLRIGRGEVPVTLAPEGDRVTVSAPYLRGRMDETLGDDLTVELAISAGTVAVSARRLLELAPGEVLALGRPAQGQVELVVGRRVIGKGELIDVDGELAVRVVTIHPR